MDDFKLNTDSETEQNPAGTEEPLFAGDKGSFTFEVRQLLVALLRGPYILKSEKPQLWQTLVQFEPAVERWLAEVFLRLEISHEDGVAFCRQAESEERDLPQLVSRLTLTFLDSVLVVELRERLMRAESSGEKALIDRTDIEATLRLFEASARTDEKLFAARVNAVIKRMQERHFLKAAGRGTQLYSISPVLKLLFNASEVTKLKASYKARSKTAPAADEIDASEESDTADNGETL